MFVTESFYGNSGPLQEVQRVRGIVYRDDQLEDPEKITNGRYVDANDRRSYHVVARTIDGDIVGVFKITPRTRRHRMKLESDVSAEILGIRPRAKCAELARLAVLVAYRNLGAALALWQAAYRLLLDLGVEEVYAFQRSGPLRTQEKMGLPVVRLSGEMTGQYGLQLTPTRIIVADIIPTLARTNLAMAYLFARELPGGVFDPSSALNPPASELAVFKASIQPRVTEFPLAS